MKIGRTVAGIAALGVVGVIAPHGAASAAPGDPPKAVNHVFEGKNWEWNPCTGEVVEWTVTFHSFWVQGADKDKTTTSEGTGVGLTSGTAYRLILRGTGTSEGTWEVMRLISQGPASNLTVQRTNNYDDPTDGGPIYDCS